MNNVSPEQYERVKGRMIACLSCHSGRDVEIDHALCYAGRQITDDWNLQPLCKICHRGRNGTVKQLAKVRSAVRAIEMGMECGEIESKYPDRDWKQEIKKYKNYIEKNKERVYTEYANIFI